MKAFLLKYKITGILIMVALVVYQLAISKTIEEYSQSKKIEAQITKASSSDAAIYVLEKEKAIIENKIHRFSSDSIKNKEYIFHSLAEFCKNKKIRLRDFPEEGITTKGGYLIETNKVLAEGDFGDLLRLVNHIEYNSNIGKISSVNFYVYKDHKIQKDILLAGIYIQNLSIK